MSELPPKRGRGRPPSINTEQALSAMIELFRGKGFDAVSLDDLSDATGLSRPSLYRSFGDKLSMYINAMRAFEIDAGSTALPALEQHDDLETALTAFYDEMLSIYFRDESIAPGCLVFATAPAAVDQDEVKEWLASGVRRLDSLMKDRIQRASPGANAETVQTAADIAANTLIAFSARAKSGASHGELQQMGVQNARLISNIVRLAN